jgi:hypothetical protein
VIAVLAHDVGSAVENGGSGVDGAGGSMVVHPSDRFAHRPTRLSSTALTALDASVHRSCATFSPASTDAKTMDENFYSVADNDKSDHQVEVGDNRPVERSDA